MSLRLEGDDEVATVFRRMENHELLEKSSEETGEGKFLNKIINRIKK